MIIRRKIKTLRPFNAQDAAQVNGTTGKFCNKCGAALDLVTAINVDKEKVSLTMELLDVIQREPALLGLLKGHMEARNETNGTNTQRILSHRSGNG